MNFILNICFVEFFWKNIYVDNITTFDVKMTILIKDAYWKILKVFYLNRNVHLHLRYVLNHNNLADK